MAWGTKYEILTRDIHNVLWTTHIKLQDYTGAVTHLIGAGENPLRFEHLTESDDLADPIKSSRAILTVFSYSMFAHADLYSDDDMHHRVEIKQGANLYWSGFIDPKQYKEPYGPVPYITEITCIDGLTLLKNIRYEQSPGTPYNGLRFTSQIILDILGKIDFSSFREFVNVYEINMSAATTASLFDQEKHNADGFQDDYCDEVLKKILKKYNAAIKQDNGIFTIYRPKEMAQEIVYGRNFTGPTSKTTVPLYPQQFIQRPGNTSTFQQYPGSLVTIQRPARKIICRQDYGYKESWLDNWKFEPDTFNGTTFRHWLKDPGLVIGPIKELIATEENGLYIDNYNSTTGRIRQAFGYNAVVTATGNDKFYLEFKYAIYNPTASIISSAAIITRLYSSASGAALKPGASLDDGFWSTGDIILSETNVAPGVTEWKTFKTQCTAGLPDTGPYWMEVSKPYGTDNFYLLITEIKVGVVSGELAVLTRTNAMIARGSQRRGGYPTMSWGRMKMASIEIKEITERIYEKTNPINGEEREYEFDLGDIIGSNVDNIIEQFAGGSVAFVGSTHIPTTAWSTRGGSENKPLLELVGDELAEHFSRAKQLVDLQMWESDKGPSTFNPIGSLQDDINKRPAPSGLTGWTNGNFASFAATGLNIQTATSLTGQGYAVTNEISFRAGDIIFGNITLTLNSGLPPSIYLFSGTMLRSNVVALEPGDNQVEIISNYTGPARLFIEVANNSDFATSNTTLNKMINRVFATNRGTFNVKSRTWKIDLIEL